MSWAQVLGRLLFYLTLRLGEKALGMTLKQAMEWLVSGNDAPAKLDQDANEYHAGRCGCERCCETRQLGPVRNSNLDPDEGVFYWDLPTREQ